MLAAALAAMTLTWDVTGAQAAASARPAVLEKRVIGTSVQGRPIIAWHLGEPGKPVVVLFARMHGNEAAPGRILTTLRDGPPIAGVDLWVVPTFNPDGVAKHTRKNAHGVDLNRNFPYHWVDLDGSYESGPAPASEPETKAVMAFLGEIRPRRVIGFHQPLNGVDTDTKQKRFARKLARALRLPAKRFDCGGVCHGTMTGWFNRHFRGGALTVEYGAHPGARRLTRQAPGQLLRALGGRHAAPPAG